MRRSFILLLLFASGCGTGTDPKRDIAAARKYVRSCFSNPAYTVEFDLVEGPEYADIPKICRDRLVDSAPDRSAACAVRIRVTWRVDNRTSHDDWVVWVSSDHKGVGWSSNPNGDNWRQFVQKFAKK